MPPLNSTPKLWRAADDICLFNFPAIVEQATHFCDLSRYFGGEVDLSTVMAHSLEHFEPAGQLSRIPVDESKVPPQERIPRITCATW